MDDTLERTETAPPTGRPAGHDETRSDRTMTTARSHGVPTSLNWADEAPELDMEQPVVERPSTGTSAVDKDWPPLPEIDERKRSRFRRAPTAKLKH
jgi:hypothetical protein